MIFLVAYFCELHDLKNVKKKSCPVQHNRWSAFKWARKGFKTQRGPRPVPLNERGEMEGTARALAEE